MAKAARMRAQAVGNGVVLALVVVSIALQMIVASSDLARFLTVGLQALTLVIAVRSSGERRLGLQLAALLALTAVAAAVLIWLVEGELPVAASAIVNGLLVAVAPVAIARGLVNKLAVRGQVTVETLAGVLAIYLLVGMFFSFLYGIIGAVDESGLFAGHASPDRSDELYFSFVTLSTVGYGDFVPLDDVPRMLAVAEMLIGQIYLVTIVALIVSNLRRPREPQA